MVLNKTFEDICHKIILKSNYKDIFLKNASFLFGSSITALISGFIYWIVIARIYITDDVGIASALISATAAIMGFSSFGFDFALIKYLPNEYNKKDLINTCISISLLSSLVLSFFFVIGINIWSPRLSFLNDSLPISLIFIIITAINSMIYIIMTGVFVGLRSPKYTFYLSIMSFLRIIICPFLVTMGALGIYISCYISSIISIFLGIYLLSRIHSNYVPAIVLKKNLAGRILHFSLYNHIAKVLETLPIFFFTLVIINLLGATMNAYFYIAYSISAIFIIIPSSISNSFLTECFYSPERFKENLEKSIIFIIELLIISIICIILFGKLVLSAFGGQYPEYSYPVLLLLSIASIPVSVNYVFVSIRRVQNKMNSVITIFGLIAIISVILSYLLLLLNYGIAGVGIAWIIGNGIIAGSLMLKSYFNDKQFFYMVIRDSFRHRLCLLGR